MRHDRNKCLCLIRGARGLRGGPEGDIAWREGKWATAPCGVRRAFHFLPQERGHLAPSAAVGVSGPVFIDQQEVPCARAVRLVHVVLKKRRNNRFIDGLSLFNYCHGHTWWWSNQRTYFLFFTLRVFHKGHLHSGRVKFSFMLKRPFAAMFEGSGFALTFPIVARQPLHSIVFY